MKKITVKNLLIIASISFIVFCGTLNFTLIPGVTNFSITQKVYADDHYEKEEDNNDHYEDEDDNNDHYEDEDDNEDTENYQNNTNLIYVSDINTLTPSDIADLSTVDMPAEASSSTIDILSPDEKIAPIHTFEVSQIETGRPLTYYINTLLEANLINGSEDIIFNPFNDASRLESLSLILKSLDIPTDSTVQSSFTDINQDDSYAPIINTAVQKGIINGFDDGTFRPNDTVKRSELLKMIFTAYGFNFQDMSPEEQTFSDEDILHWSAPYLEAAKFNNILSGYSDGTAGPGNNITRGELAKIVLMTKKQSYDTKGLKLPRMMDPNIRITMINQRETLEAARKAKQNAPTPVRSVPVAQPIVNTVSSADIEKQRQVELQRQAAVEAQQAEAARIAKEKAAAEAARIAQEKAAAAEAARIAQEKATTEAAAAARSRRTRRS